MIPQITPKHILPTSKVPCEDDYKSLHILRVQTNKDHLKNYEEHSYQFMHDTDYYPITGTLTRKGNVVHSDFMRLAFFAHLSLQKFVDIVQYDPSDPPRKDYNALQMIDSHEKTQADFKGQKTKNKNDFENYLVEAVTDQRTAYLPIVAGWQSVAAFERTVFVAYDESDPNAMYGVLYLPKLPIMQSDGQTQTAALFGLAKSKDAVESEALPNFHVGLEIELKVDQEAAGQSFADRNGRGVKKNKNLVIGLDTSSPVAKLRSAGLKGTIFEDRIATGRNTGVSVTAVENIIDLSTAEQMALLVAGGGRFKPEHIKSHHVSHFQPFVSDFFKLLSDQFDPAWNPHLDHLGKPKKGVDTYRRLYVHGWAFCLKALALAYHDVRSEEIDKIVQATTLDLDGRLSKEDAFTKNVALATSSKTPAIDLKEFKQRLSKIDWLRHRKHWIAITGYSEKDGNKRTFKLKSTGQEVVAALAQNSGVFIDKTCDKILSKNWTDLCAADDEPLS
jgi:hypothetical protein